MRGSHTWQPTSPERRASTGAALRVLLVLTVVLGVVYPLVVTGVGQVAFRDKAERLAGAPATARPSGRA